MIDFIGKPNYTFSDLVQLVKILRAPEGCPWDRVQTHESIRRNFIEEVYEACEAIDKKDPALLREELGDVLLHVVFHADLEEDAGNFTIDDVCDSVIRKMIFRHPNLFSEGSDLSWDELKLLEKGQKAPSESMESVAKSLPALWRAEKILGKAEKAGLAPADAQAASASLTQGAMALEEAVKNGENPAAAMESVLFSAVSLCRRLSLDPEVTLHRACDDYISRFSRLEAAADRPLSAYNREELENLWNRVK